MSINYKTFGQGNFQQTGPRSGKFTGPKHANGGIKTAGPDGNMIEVEGGESVGEVNTNAGKQPYIYSQYVKRYGGVSYADEFDKMVSRGASQQELDMLASEQDSKAQRTDGSIQVTPMQRGGFTNNINNNNMANRLSRRVMQYDSRYRNGGVPQYQGQTYSGVDGDLGPAALQQKEDALAQRQEDGTDQASRKHWWGKGPWYQNILNPISWLGNSLLSPQKTAIETSYQGYDKLTGGDSEITPGSNFSGNWSDYQTYQYGGMPNQQIQPGAYGVHQGDIGQRQTGLQYQGGGFPMPTNPQMRNPYGYANTAMAPGLGNRVMQYQGDIGTGITHDARVNEFREMGGQPHHDARVQDFKAMGEGDVVNQMMSMLQFSNQQGIESLPIEAQSQVRAEFAAMTKEEQQQWINFMTNGPEVDASGNPTFQQKSPTRVDKNEELIQKVLQSAPYSPTPSGEQIPLGPSGMN